MINTIIFDIGGVIISSDVERIDDKISDYLSVNHDDFKTSASRYKEALTKGKFGLKEYYSSLLKDLEIKDVSIDDVLSHHLDIFRKIASKQDPKVVEVINELKANYNLYCLVNAELDVVPIVREEGIYDYFKKAYISTKMRMKKPEDEAYLAVLKDLKLNPSNVLFIDDKLENVIAAEKLGIASIHYRQGTNLRKELKSRNILLN